MSAGPVLDRELIETSEMGRVAGDEHQSGHVSDSRNLTVHVRRGPAQCLETGSLLPVPTCGNLVVRQDGNEARTTSRRSRRDVAPGGPVAGGRREAVLEADLVQRILL